MNKLSVKIVLIDVKNLGLFTIYWHQWYVFNIDSKLMHNIMNLTIWNMSNVWSDLKQEVEKNHPNNLKITRQNQCQILDRNGCNSMFYCNSWDEPYKCFPGIHDIPVFRMSWISQQFNIIHILLNSWSYLNCCISRQKASYKIIFIMFYGLKMFRKC